MSASILLVRHGESEGNVAGTLDTSLPGPPLTELGRSQARTRAAGLRERWVDEVVSSRALRARETAEQIGVALGLPVRAVDGLHEVEAGALEGDADRRSWARYESVLNAWLSGDLRPRMPGGRDGVETVERALAAVGPLLRAAEGTTVVVGHGGLIRLLTRAVDPPVDAASAVTNRLGNTAFVELIHREGRWDCASWPGVR